MRLIRLLWRPGERLIDFSQQVVCILKALAEDGECSAQSRLERSTRGQPFLLQAKIIEHIERL